MRRHRIPVAMLAATLATAGCVTTGTTAAGPVISCSDRFTMTRNDAVLSVPICTSRPLDQADSTVEAVVIVIHGASRDAASYFNSMNEAVALAAVTDTLVIAPRFMYSKDMQPMPADMLYFDSRWREGGQSIGQRPWSESSFGVVDHIVTRMADRSLFPNLRSVVIAGHSAGGQFANRYAAGNRSEPALTGSGYEFRYVVANPSTYLYMSNERRVSGSVTEFAVPNSATIASCPGYDTYKFGLAGGLNAYMTSVGADAIRSQYQARGVAYLLGELDTDPNHPTLGNSCEARMQGAHRFERGTIYYNHLGRVFGAGVYARHTKAVVPAVGHSARAMFTSEVGRAYVFGLPPPPPPPTTTPITTTKTTTSPATTSPATTSSPTTTGPPTTAPPSGPTTYLSDLPWVSATNGLGPVERDRSVGGGKANDGGAIRIDGRGYAKGLGTHPRADITYDLNRAYARFLVELGIDDVCGGAGSVDYEIYLDGIKTYAKRVVGTNPVQLVSIDVSGVTELHLVVTDGGDGFNCDHADWADARLVRPG